MEYTYLKGTGLKVSRMCLGTMTFGGQTDEAASIEITNYAIDNGVNFIDTANIYTATESERILGVALKGKRDDVVLATKVSGPVGRKPNNMGLGRKHVIKSVEDSLKRLGTDYIDILYMHFPDTTVNNEEMVETMTNLVRSGKIRYYGVSNFSAWQFCSLVHTAKEMNAVAPAVTQSVYNIVTRGIEDEMVPFLKEYKKGLTLFNPLAGGLLTGKHTREKTAENSRFSLERGYAMRYLTEKNYDALDELRKVAADYGVTMVGMAYKWLCDKDYVTSPICGISKMSQIEENVTYFDGEKADPEMIKACDKVWDNIKGNYFNYHR
ncbi:MAG: aldo/keto reductase [Eubacteriaceae bacterium]|nr:aldo/keto reductase [Eubacteriaceae bacterium]